MPPLSLLIKPASGNCNLRCRYCFYHTLSESRSIKSYGIMDINTLEVLVKKSLEYADQVCTFAFQGGEPTIAGIDFFKNLVEFGKMYNTKRLRINYALQTNGMFIDDEWAQFLSQNNFLVGLSLDGPKDINDMNRIGVNDKGSFNRVMKTVDLFNKYKVEYNILSVVNASVARHANKVYNFFKKQGFNYLQFIPCLDPLSQEPGKYNFSLKPDDYTKFLKSTFDQWYNDIIRGNMISIRYFDNIVGILMGYRPEACGMMGQCACQFVVEADGGVYPCDFYVTDEWHLGNIKDSQFEDMRNSENGKRFVEVSIYIAPECKECRWFNLCRGGCRRNREPFVNGKPVLNYYCDSYREFFDYAYKRLCHVADIVSRRTL